MEIVSSEKRVQGIRIRLPVWVQSSKLQEQSQYTCGAKTFVQHGCQTGFDNRMTTGLTTG